VPETRVGPGHLGYVITNADVEQLVQIVSRCAAR
jgi:hypothetical protein